MSSMCSVQMAPGLRPNGKLKSGGLRRCAGPPPRCVAGRGCASRRPNESREPPPRRGRGSSATHRRRNTPGSAPRRTSPAAGPPLPSPRWLADGERASRRQNDSRDPPPWRRRRSSAPNEPGSTARRARRWPQPSPFPPPRYLCDAARGTATTVSVPWPSGRLAVLRGRRGNRIQGDDAVVQRAPAPDRAGIDDAAHGAGCSPVVSAAVAALQRGACRYDGCRPGP